LRFWLNGRILTEESRKYIHNFIVVTCVRPGDAEEEDRSDEQVSDEELEVNEFNFAEVIETRIGGVVAGEHEEETGDDSEDGARQGAHDVANPGSERATAAPRSRRPRSRETAKGIRSRGRVSEAGVYQFEGPSWTAGRKYAEQDI
jgi:hypothetical protein